MGDSGWCRATLTGVSDGHWSVRLAPQACIGCSGQARCNGWFVDRSAELKCVAQSSAPAIGSAVEVRLDDADAWRGLIARCAWMLGVGALLAWLVTTTLATDATWLQAFAFIAGALVAAYFPRSTFAAALPLARVLAHPISP